MFQYSFGRILAEQMNYKLIFRPADNESNIFLNHYNILSNFQNICEINGNEIKDLVFVTNDNFGYNINNLLKFKNVKGLLLHGWFQRKQYYINYLPQIKKWFYLTESQNNLSINSQDIVIHIRRTDFKLDTVHHINHCIKLNYYTDILEKNSWNRLFICGDEFDEEVKKSFLKFNPFYYHVSEIEDLKFMKQFNKIIMSNSTFAWWASVLSEANEIYFPKTKNPLAFFNHDQDLLMPNFIPIENVETYN